MIFRPLKFRILVSWDSEWNLSSRCFQSIKNAFYSLEVVIFDGLILPSQAWKLYEFIILWLYLAYFRHLFWLTVPFSYWLLYLFCHGDMSHQQADWCHAARSLPQISAVCHSVFQKMTNKITRHLYLYYTEGYLKKSDLQNQEI